MKHRNVGKMLLAPLVVSILISLNLLFYNGNDKGNQDADCIAVSNKMIEIADLISIMFPEKTFVKKDNMFYAGARENYYIESIIPGSFVNKEGNELLVVARRPKNEMYHAAGFYQVYAAVFDSITGRMISGVINFHADEGRYWILNSKGISYVFFAGSTTYQGWTDWDGGLWKAGSKWTLEFPKEKGYWKDKAIEFEDNVFDNHIFNIFKRRMLKDTIEPLPPKYAWDYSYSLVWDKETAGFKHMESDAESKLTMHN